MQFSTTPTLEGQPIVEYCGVVTGEAILGANIFRDFFAGIRDIVGGRSGAYEKELRKAREIAFKELGEQAEAAGFMDSNPLRSRLAGGSSCELAIRLSKNVGQHIRINPALFERSGGEILSGLQLIVAKGQAMGTVECNNAPQSTRDLRMGVEEQFRLQQGLTGWDGLDSRRRNSSETLELKQRCGRPVGARCGDDNLGHARNVSVLSHQTSP